MPKDDENQLEGEGSYTGAAQYDRDAERWTKEGDVEKAAEEAREDYDKDEPAYRQAEEAGKARAAEEDRFLRHPEGVEDKL